MGFAIIEIIKHKKELIILTNGSEEFKRFWTSAANVS